MEEKESTLLKDKIYKKKISFSVLAKAMGIEASRLNKYIHPNRKRPSLHTAVRMAAAMHTSYERATEIIRCTGYDITYDNYPENKVYRNILSGTDMTVAEMNKLLFEALGENENGTDPYLCGWVEDI